MINRDTLMKGLTKGDSRIRKTLDQAYNVDVSGRLLTLLENFGRNFPQETEISILKAPGRVNLIGEHLDYNSLPVLPMAMDYDMLVALSPRSDLEVRAVNPEFEDRAFEIEKENPALRDRRLGELYQGRSTGDRG